MAGNFVDAFNGAAPKDGDTRLANMRIRPGSDGVFTIEALTGTSSESGVTLHAPSHYSGPDALDIDQIPGTLDAAKLYGNALIDTLVARSTVDSTEFRAYDDPEFPSEAPTISYVGSAARILFSDGTLLGSDTTVGRVSAGVFGSVLGLIRADELGASGRDSAYHLSRANHTGTQDWSTITGEPTTIAGYGITDQIAYLNVAQTFTAQQRFDNTFAQSAAPSNSIAFRLNYGAFTGVSQQGLFVDPLFTSAATAEAYSAFFRVETENASFTLPIAAAIRIPDAIKGASNTLQTLVALDIAAQTAGTTNIAIRTGNTRCLFGGEIEIDGPLNHDGTTAGVFNTTPATRTAAYTQAYATASRTLAAYTADSESVAYTGAADGEATLADLNALRVAYENLRAFVESIAGVLNSHTDDLQLYGWFQ